MISNIQQFKIIINQKVFSNNLLDKRQKEVIDKFMSLEQKRILVSARHHLERLFAKRDYFLNRERYQKYIIAFPTIALLNENTECKSVDSRT